MARARGLHAWHAGNDNAWWGVVVREPRLAATGHGLLLYLDKAFMAVDSGREH